MGTLVQGNNGVIAGPDADGLSFAAAGFTTGNLRLIKRIGNPTRSFDPTPGKINSFDSFVKNAVYEIKMKTGGLVVASLFPPLPDEDAPVVVNKRYAFAGADQSMSVANPSAFYFGSGADFSVHFKGRITAAGGILRLGVGDATHRGWDIMMYESGGNVHIDFTAFQGANDSGGNAITFAKSHVMTGGLNNEYNICVTFNGTDTAHIYVNDQDATLTGTPHVEFTGIGANLGGFRIGLVGNDPSLNSQMDDLFIIGRVISKAENDAVNLLSDPKTSPLYANDMISLWKFNDSLLDEKGAHNGTATAPAYAA